MIKKLLFSAVLFSLMSVSASAQSFYAEFNYQSLRPFVNFSIELGNNPYHYQRNNYQTAYLKGYMDGVNQTYYNAYRFYDLVYNIEAYEAGYRDGLRDYALFYRLRGYNHHRTRYFTYDDYYSPYYSVQIWLNQLSFTFIQAPARYLPARWEHHIHPRVKYYRKRFHNKRGFYQRFEAQFKNHNKRLKTQARYRQKRYQRTNSSYSQRSRGNIALNPRHAQQRVRSRTSNSNGRPELRRRVRSQPKNSVQPRSRSTQRVGQANSSSQRTIRVRSRTGNTKNRGEVKRNRSGREQKVERKSSGHRKVRSRSGGRQSKVKSQRKGNGRKNSRGRSGNGRRRGGNN